MVAGLLLAQPAAAGEPAVAGAPSEGASPLQVPPPDAWRTPAAAERARAGALLPAAEPPVERPSAVGRMLLGLLLGVGVGALPNALWLPLLFSGSGAAGVLFVIAMVLEPIAISVGVYSAHRILDGEGSYASALVGASLGLLGAAGVVGLTWFAAGTFDGRFDPLGFAVPLAVGVLFAIAVSAGSAEWSNERSVELRSLAVVPVSGGAQLAAGFGF